jgi:dGTPase
MTNLEPRLKIITASYAMKESKSEKKRRAPIDDHHGPADFRREFQRDRDRIIHSKAFRRLESKTQVIISHESDHNRKRLTHSLEVSQISETIAYNLGLNIFLTQAIALGHDLGHTAFGHGGEGLLDEVLKDFDKEGFKHNYQSLLVVNKLEKTYADEGGLNLMWETRDGILKHTGLDNDINVKYYDDELEKEPVFPVTLEGQVVRLVDGIAQSTHDTDDGVGSGRINFRQLLEQPLIKNVLEFAGKQEGDLKDLFEKNEDQARFYLIRSMIKFYIRDLLENTRKTLDHEGIKKYENVRDHINEPIVNFSKDFGEKDEEFRKNFLRPNFYDHYEVKRMDSRGKYFLRRLFNAFKDNPKQLPKGTFDIYKKEILDDLKGRIDRGEAGSLTSKELEEERLPCQNRCRYIPKSRMHEIHISTFKNASNEYICPLQKEDPNNPACEGIRVIINHLAGMTDRHANLEYARLYIPPEISRI